MQGPRKTHRLALLSLALLGACATGRSLRDQSQAALTLLNRTTEDVCYIYLSAVDADSWSDDVLDSGSIGPGRARRVNLPIGLWDVRTENCQHEVTGVVRRARINHGTNLLLQ